MKKYFLYDGTTQHGPFDLADLETKIITPQTMVWYESLPEWKPASEIEELRNLLNSKVPASQILTPPVIKAKDEDWSKKLYYYTDNHGQQGPFTLEQLKNRPIHASTQVWYDPLPEWTTADKVAGLNEIVASAQKTTATVTTQKEETGKKQYYYLDNAGQKQGPFTLEQLGGKPINAATLIWYDPLPEWIKAGSEESLKNIVANAQPVQTTPSVQQKSYYYLDGAGQKQGPFTLEQLNGKPINAATLIWYDPLPDWIKAGNEESLKNIVANAQPVQTTPSAHKKSYYYLDGAGQKQGPFTLEQLGGKSITAATLIWYDPLPEWIKAGSEESLKSIISAAQPVHNTTAPGRLYYYMDSAGQQQGPFRVEQMSGKSITAATLIWYDSLPQWIKAGSEESLKNIIGNGTSGVDWSKKLFYYTDATGQQGPFTLEQLRGKPITMATPVWYDPLPQWTTAGQVEGLRGIVR